MGLSSCSHCGRGLTFHKADTTAQLAAIISRVCLEQGLKHLQRSSLPTKHPVDDTVCCAPQSLPTRQISPRAIFPSGPFFPPQGSSFAQGRCREQRHTPRYYLQLAVVCVWFFGTDSTYVKESLTRKGNISKVVASFCNQLFSRLAVICLMRRLFPVTNE